MDVVGWDLVDVWAAPGSGGDWDKGPAAPGSQIKIAVGGWGCAGEIGEAAGADASGVVFAGLVGTADGFEVGAEFGFLGLDSSFVEGWPNDGHEHANDAHGDEGFDEGEAAFCPHGYGGCSGFLSLGVRCFCGGLGRERGYWQVR